MHKRLIILLFAGLCSMGAAAQDHTFHKMAFEKLPSLNAPRGNHRTVVFDGEVAVFGGHTTGFKPLETAEYYKNGSWHRIPMTWPHDGGAITLLNDGRVFLAGGNAEAFGIGQSWGAEIYDPSTHSFSPIGIMSRKRTQPSALELQDGRIMIAGNWHGPDGVEIYSPGGGFEPVKDLEPGWTFPYMLNISKDEVIIFSSLEPYGDSTAAYVERINGGPLEVPLLEEWEPILNYSICDDNLKIADYTYLLLFNHRRSNEATIAKVSGEDFSLLELECPLPSEGPGGEALFWRGGPQVDRSLRHAWIQGQSLGGNIYFACIGYDATFDGGKASVELYYAEKPGGFPNALAALMDGGDFILAGGVGILADEPGLTDDNFNPLADVYLFHTEEPAKATVVPIWAIVLGAVLVCAVVLLLVVRQKEPAPAEPVVEKAQKLNADLLEEMQHLIEEKNLFLRKDLRVADIASELATNQTYVSVLVNNLTGDNFATMIGGYRIRYAQNLMREHPEMVHADVAEASGFASRAAFLRTFKAQTGLTPTEWKQKEGIDDNKNNQ